ncbi:MAG: aspartyl protease family protein [Pseudarcicella sp.]|nr:aspartyl protease family protein [Pseudarcicella sp.]
MTRFTQIFILFFVSIVNTYSQNDLIGFQFAKNRRTVHIPFQFHANLIIVPLKINDSDTLHFILDTGLGVTLLTDPSVVRFLKPTINRQVTVKGIGSGENLAAGLSINNLITIGDAVGYQQNITVLKDGTLDLWSYVGTKIHGIIGYEFFSPFVVSIDFENKIITLQKPEHYSYKKRKGEKFQIIIEKNKPYLNDIVITNGKSTSKIKAIIDSGAGHAFLLETSSNIIFDLPPVMVPSSLGMGLNGSINGHLGRLEKIQIGNTILSSVITSFPDSTSIKSSTPKRNIFRGNIGGEFLKRFKVTFNYHDKYIVLKPIKHQIKQAFEYNMSGIELVAKGENFTDFIIESVTPNSPAYHAGLQKGDLILYIDNKASQELKASEIYNLLQKKDGEQINMIVNREGASRIFVSFVLKKLI